MSQESENIRVPRGFRFSSHASGIKQSGKPDVSVLVADHACVTHGAFTQNLVRASSVDWNESNIGLNRALVINSGNANACTGEQGEKDTAAMASRLADQVACSSDQVLVMSTGIIGEMLPMELLHQGIDAAFGKLDEKSSSVYDFAEGILTTDSSPKICSQEFETERGTFTILGICKGAGMIGPKMANPKMATMLCVLLTDFPLARFDSNSRESYLDNEAEFQAIINRTFNSISVDGHTSTSDQVVLFAPVTDGVPSKGESQPFFNGLEKLCVELAKKIPADGEGATHLISIEVRGNYSDAELRSVAKTVADSPLVKTAVFGADPNWGRIVSAAGYDGLEFDPSAMTLWVNGNLLFENGTPAKFDAAAVSQSMKENFETEIRLDLGQFSEGENPNTAKYWTSDLTYDYVKINAEYHT